MDDSRVLLAHGGGGVLMAELINDVILPAIGSDGGVLMDAALFAARGELAFTTDSFVVKPIFFPGGNVGSMAVHGTVNDLAVSGARPLYISLSLIIEEGLEIDILRRILESSGRAARDAGVSIITGDTKVVTHGDADGIYITTSGVGSVVRAPDVEAVSAGDAVIVTGCIAEHGIAVMSARQGIDFQTVIQSDSASVWPMVEALLAAEPRVMRDPTRGGVAACCNELAVSSGTTIVLDEKQIPLLPAVAGACDMLGLDPLTVANEGKVIAIVPAEHAEQAVDALRTVPGGQRAAIIGTVLDRRERPVLLTTRYGGERILEMPYGEDLPRIC